MSLQISYVERFEDVLDPVIEFLSRDRDLFAKPRIVVPHAGAKAWLWSELARRLGTSVGPNGKRHPDGIVANVEISYPGTILSLLQPKPGTGQDHWSFDPMTFTVLEVLAAADIGTLGIPFDVMGEPLLAARRIAGLLDEYHVRRPEMIREWARSQPNRVLNPTANDERKGGGPDGKSVPVPDGLAESDRWQFEVWKRLRDRIGGPSPPERASVAHRPHDVPLLVAGLQSLSWPQLSALQALGTVCDVEALLVHPSPGLRTAWHKIGPQPLEADLLGRPLRRSRRKPDEEPGDEEEQPGLPEGFDPLPTVWLRGSQELQGLITSQAVSVVERTAASHRPADSLLKRMQDTVVTGLLPEEPQAFDPALDHSVTIHRCHNLARQAEVLHEALLHAFADPKLEGLQPHDVVIVSPCLDEAAPHLEAVFQRTVGEMKTGDGKGRFRLPLVVADRGIRETSEAVDLLVKLLSLPGSRCSVDDVLAVACHPLVRAHFGTNDDTEATWIDLVERTQIRWGLDAEHRDQRGLTIADGALRDVHTWKSGLEQMLLGVMLPDAATAEQELGGVVPLADLEPADIDRVTKLIRVLDVVGGLASLTAEPRPGGEWCDAIETALVGLCGEHCRHLAEPLAQIRRLREAAAGAAVGRTVGFQEIRTLLAEWFDDKAGRQPLRTGAITATSMVPLRGVPFRVVCVIGFDDGVVGVAEPGKDDLVARMPLLGDGDPLTDSRRALLDCLLAARDRLVITTTGRDVRSNEEIALVTPLAELVDFAVRHGVLREKIGALSAIEMEQPRHHLGRRNFLFGAIQPGVTWSHDRLAAEVAKAPLSRSVNGRNESEPTGNDGSRDGAAEKQDSDQPKAKPDLDFSVLERMVRDPLGLHLEENYQISTWRDDEEPTPATLPLALDERPLRKMTLELLHVLLADPSKVADWKQAALASGRLPPGPHGRRQLREIELLAEGLRYGLEAHHLDFAARIPKSLEVINLGACRVVGEVDDYEPTQQQFVFVMPQEIDKDTSGRPLHKAALRLLAARAADIPVTQATIISRRDEWRPGKKSPTKKQPDRMMEAWQARIVRLSPDLTPTAAARARLLEVVALAREAITEPRPAFRKVITCDAKDRPQQFSKQLRSEYYNRSAEAMVFGINPSFDEVFGNSPPRTAFLDTFKNLLEPEHSKTTKVYELA